MKRTAAIFRFTTFRIFALTVTLFLLGATFPVQNQSLREYQLKAAFIYNFTQFVEWPSSAFKREDSPFVIGILGEDPFGPYLDQLLTGETVGNHPLKVLRYHRADDVGDCHILFINLKSGNYERIWSRLEKRNVLTVGDHADFAARGGMIQMHTDRNKIRLRINLEAVKERNLQVSSKLLRLAEVI